MNYSDDFLSALGQWQNGWAEDRERRLPIAEQLERSIADLPGPLPKNEMRPCYRKRFLVPNNPENGGDFVPLFRDGRIDEGLASWTTNLVFAKSFKSKLRVGQIMTIFECKPTPEMVIVDFPALWNDGDFVNSVECYSAKSGPHAAALENFRATQFEMILSASLLADSIVGFGGPVSSVDEIAKSGGIEDLETIEALEDAMNDDRIYQGDLRWVEGMAAQRVFYNAAAKIATRFRSSQP